MCHLFPSYLITYFAFFSSFSSCVHRYTFLLHARSPSPHHISLFCIHVLFPLPPIHDLCRSHFSVFAVRPRSLSADVLFHHVIHPFVSPFFIVLTWICVYITVTSGSLLYMTLCLCCNVRGARDDGCLRSIFTVTQPDWCQFDLPRLGWIN